MIMIIRLALIEEFVWGHEWWKQRWRDGYTGVIGEITETAADSMESVWDYWSEGEEEGGSDVCAIEGGWVWDVDSRGMLWIEWENHSIDL